MDAIASLAITNARVTTLDPARPQAEAVAVHGNRILAVGSEAEVRRHIRAATQVVDGRGRRLIPGLIDSHIHVIRGGLNFTLELRWDGISSLADAMRLLREQVARTPTPQWVRVVGGFTVHQFAERRLPTLDELNAVAPDTPVFILHLYDRALLNRAALAAAGYTRETPNPPGGEIVRDARGEPTGLLLARPNALLLYSALARGPKLSPEYQLNSTRHFMRELNRLGVTSVVDAGGGFQNYPDDYQVIDELHRNGQLTLRIAYNLFTQKPKEEVADFLRWTSASRYQQGDDFYKLNGAGEMLVFSAADFEDFREPRPELPAAMEGELEAVIRVLAARRWPWRMHATYDETIGRALDVFERVDRDIPLSGIHWFFDHAETVTDRNLERIARLGGGVAIQHRMAFQGEDFIARYGTQAAGRTPPFRRMLEMGIQVGAGTDATRVASYDPWTLMHWLTTGHTVGGTALYGREQCLSRVAALDLCTRANTWFSNERGLKGQVVAGQLADLALLSRDFLEVDEDDIRGIRSLLTVCDGKVVFAAGEYASFDPPLPPVLPDWSPVKHAARIDPVAPPAAANGLTCAPHSCQVHGTKPRPSATWNDSAGFWGPLGCSCWVF
ncbi:MAG: Amidohydrolase 3 [Steroidobacteraceae bacterium]|jgi:predicted amidohydrolase YtcJ|nr:Amidohydrolase 3 [Steroidobacteraceae bacterium]